MNSTSTKVQLRGFSDACPTEASLLRSRLNFAAEEFAQRTKCSGVEIVVNSPEKSGTEFSASAASGEDEIPFEVRTPQLGFNDLCYAEDVKKKILGAASIVKAEEQIFDKWGLRNLRATPRSILLLSGMPGTGKTAAAEALATHLGKPLVCASYPDLESKYLGEGPKRVAAFFAAVRRSDGLAFIDEADSLLGNRMKVTQGSERAANAMTSQLLIELERHRGLVVFTTNLIENIDRAFRSRVIKVDVPLPDFETRKRIWQVYLEKAQGFPLNDFDIDDLAAVEGVSGRDICNSLFVAAGIAVESDSEVISGSELIEVLKAQLHDQDSASVVPASVSSEIAEKLASTGSQPSLTSSS